MSETNHIIFELIKRKGVSNLYIQQQQQQQQQQQRNNNNKWSYKNTRRLPKSLNDENNLIRLHFSRFYMPTLI